MIGMIRSEVKIAAPADSVRQQERQPETEQDLDRGDRQRPFQGGDGRLPDERIVEGAREVVEPDERPQHPAARGA